MKINGIRQINLPLVILSYLKLEISTAVFIKRLLKQEHVLADINASETLRT